VLFRSSDGPTIAILADALDASGRPDEAIRVATEGLQVAKDRVDLYNTRGEIRRRMGQFEAALADYQAAIELDPQKVDAHFNIATAMIALGRTTETPAVLTTALEAYQGKRDADRGLLIVCFHENLIALFLLAAEGTFRGFLSQGVDLALRARVLVEFEKALGTTLFALLREHAAIEESRYRSIESALRESMEGRIDISVILRLLDTGIRFFKRNDRKALLNLPNEERALFVSELGIADPKD
jgi:tetratricopeptide (TPR) repeat protein